ncbi:MAG TPA: hypothetical protein VLQ88_10310 [Chromatiaceae bacterium]|nr:hypothetical protein [Chromatiaceae bacterium]
MAIPTWPVRKPPGPGTSRGGWPYVAWAVLISVLILVLTLLGF